MLTNIEKALNWKENKICLEEWFNDNKPYGICPDSRYANGYENDKLKYRKVLPCNKEWCPVCGQEGSLVHRQRFGRGIFKIIRVKTLGYFVITFPLEVRDKFSSKLLLGAFSDFMRDLLKGYPFIKGGVSRWHWGGDKHQGEWNPHLNILVNTTKGWLEDDILNNIKGSIKEWVCKNLGDVNCVVMEYHFYMTVKEKVHKWKYVTRPTMLLCGDKIWEMGVLGRLSGFRNIRWWGKWQRIKERTKDRGLKVLNDKEVKWCGKGYFSRVKDETLSEWKYVGYGIFEYDSS